MTEIERKKLEDQIRELSGKNYNFKNFSDQRLFGMTEDIEDSPKDAGKAFDDVSIEDIITLKVEQGRYIPEAVDYTDERIDDIIYNIIPLPQLSDTEGMEEYYYNRDLDKVFIVRQEDIE